MLKTGGKLYEKKIAENLTSAIGHRLNRCPALFQIFDTQDVYKRQLQGNPSEADFGVLNMLNAKYIIGPDNQLLTNPGALGNAWFADTLRYVDGANAEMEALSNINTATTAVADSRFRPVLGEAAPKAPGDTIYETSYAPARLTYRARSARGGVAIFSEVYFPWGWEITIDGKPADIARANYLLRAARIPAGEHTIAMTFAPVSYTHLLCARCRPGADPRAFRR